MSSCVRHLVRTTETGPKPLDSTVPSKWPCKHAQTILLENPSVVLKVQDSKYEQDHGYMNDCSVASICACDAASRHEGTLRADWAASYLPQKHNTGHRIIAWRPMGSPACCEPAYPFTPNLPTHIYAVLDQAQQLPRLYAEEHNSCNNKSTNCELNTLHNKSTSTLTQCPAPCQ